MPDAAPSEPSKVKASDPGMAPGLAAWAALVVPLWLVLLFCVHGEPVSGDGWGHYWWHRRESSNLRSLVELFGEFYLYENPRLGQLATLLAYTPGPYHAIVTPDRKSVV